MGERVYWLLIRSPFFLLHIPISDFSVTSGFVVLAPRRFIVSVGRDKGTGGGGGGNGSLAASDDNM